MAEHKQEVKVFEVNYQCDTCGKGNMQYVRDGITYDVSPNYRHQCDNPHCKDTLDLPRIYPRGETVPVKRKR